MGMLMKNELIKLFGRKSSWGMWIVLIVSMFGMAFAIMKSNTHSRQYYDDYDYKGGMTAYQDENGNILSENDFWYLTEGYDQYTETSLSLDETVTFLENRLAQLNNDKKADKEMVKATKNQLAFYQVYQEKGAQPADSREGTNSAQFFSIFGSLYVLPTLFSVIVASIIIASEFSGGTIKLLLVRPFSRIQILMSKYIVTFVYSVITSVIMAVSAFAFSYLLPIQKLTLPVSEQTGAKTAIELAAQLFASNLLLMVLYITIAFFFSAVIRSQALAVGVGMGILFSGSFLGQILPNIIAKYDWLKWIIFNMLGLNNQVMDANYLAAGNLSIQQTAIGIVAYIVIILIATLVLFKKRDVALT